MSAVNQISTNRPSMQEYWELVGDKGDDPEYHRNQFTYLSIEAISSLMMRMPSYSQLCKYARNATLYSLAEKSGLALFVQCKMIFPDQM